jgi:hypothetical protein
VVVALLQAIKERLPEHEPKAVIRLLLQLHMVKGPLGILHLQGEFLLPTENLQVNEIARTDAIDAEQPVTTLKAQLLPDRTGLHPHHLGGLGKAWGIPCLEALEGNPCRRLNPHALKRSKTYSV